MYRKFNHLNVPETWRHYWSKYPEGYTILEALLNWVNQVNEMSDNLTDINELVEQFMEDFDTNLDAKLRAVLEDWKDTGRLDDILAHILDLQVNYDEEVTVGTGGDYNTLNEAITYLSKKIPTHRAPSLRANVKLLSGFILREQLHVKGLHLGWIDITSEDAEVIVDRQAMTTEDPDEGYSSKSVFLGYQGATLPTIKTLFNVNETGPMAGVRFFSVRGNSNLYIDYYCGVKGKAERLLVVSHGSQVTARNSVIRDSGEINLRISNGGRFNGEYGDYSGADVVNVAVANGVAGVDYADLSNAVYDGLRVTTGPAMISANGVDATNCGRYGLQVWKGGDVNFSNSKVDGSGTHGIYMQENGMVAAKGVTANGVAGIGVLCEGAVTLDMADGSVLNSESVGIVATRGARINAPNINITGGSGYSVSVVQGSHCNFTGATLTKPAGVRVESGSNVNLNGANCRRGETDDSNDIVIDNGAIVNVTGATGGTIITANQLQPRGIILKRDI